MSRPPPLDWTQLRDFLAVTEAGSLSGAARRLGLSQPTLTRRIAALEEQLQTELFRRTARGLELTELGEALRAPVQRMQGEVADLELAVSGRDRALAGPVRITATEGLAIHWLTPRLAPFQALNPDIQLEILVHNQTVNLLRREADIAIRLGRPRQADLVSRKVCALGFGLYASRDYLDRTGRPSTRDDLRHHHGVAFDDSMRHAGPGGWLERSLGAAKVVFRANSTLAQLTAIRSGYGIGGHAHVFAARHPELERVLSDEISIDVWLVTHAGLRRSARIRAVFDLLVERFEEDAEALAGVPG